MLYHQRPNILGQNSSPEEEVYEKKYKQRLRFARKFPRVVRVIEPQGCLSREFVQLCKCSNLLLRF